MGLFFQNIDGTTKSNYKLGLNGVTLKDASGHLLVRNSDDSSFSNLTANLVSVSGDSIILNSDAAGSGDDWKITISIPSGLTSHSTLTLPINSNWFAKAVEINAQTGTTYTIDASDLGKVITCNNAGSITVTVPSGLGAGFHCSIIQKGAGQVTLSPSSTTINHRLNHTKTAGQKSTICIVADVADNFYLSGDTA